MLKTPPDMTPHLGKTIDKFCQRGIVADKTANHCAHFVSHVMEYEDFTTTCKNQSKADQALPEKGAAIRVNEIFNVAGTGSWSERPLHLTSCLIFVTNSGNMEKNGEMKNGASKHIGIYINGVVWHYSNTSAGVIKQSSVLFINQCTHSRIYIKAGQTVAFFYGRFLK